MALTSHSNRSCSSSTRRFAICCVLPKFLHQLRLFSISCVHFCPMEKLRSRSLSLHPMLLKFNSELCKEILHLWLTPPRHLSPTNRALIEYPVARDLCSRCISGERSSDRSSINCQYSEPDDSKTLHSRLSETAPTGIQSRQDKTR